MEIWAIVGDGSLHEFEFLIKHFSTKDKLIAGILSRCLLMKSETSNQEETFNNYINNQSQDSDKTIHINTLW